MSQMDESRDPYQACKKARLQAVYWRIWGRRIENSPMAWMGTARKAAAASVVILGLTWASSALASPNAGSYSGSTSQNGGSVTFTVSSTGTVVTKFEADMFATCSNGSESKTFSALLNGTPRMHIENGGFDYSGAFTYKNDPTIVGHGKGVVDGMFTSSLSSAEGTVRLPWHFGNHEGPLSGLHCDTGLVSFAAFPSTISSSSTACIVPKLKGKRLITASRVIELSNCRLGHVTRRHSQRFKRNRVIAQKPRAKTRLMTGSRVRLIISRGPR